MGPIQAKVLTFPAQAADPALFTIGVAPRGVIRTLRLLRATSGTFTYALYCSAAAFVQAAGLPTPVLATGSEAYRVTPDQVVTSEAILPGGFGLAFWYQNQDGLTTTNRQSQLYLLVTGAGTTNTLSLTITVEGSNLT